MKTVAHVVNTLSWKVAGLEFAWYRRLLKSGRKKYGVYIQLEQAVLLFKLVGVDLDQKVSPGDGPCFALICFLTFAYCFFCRRTLSIAIGRD
jgi:hypothetical protein